MTYSITGQFALTIVHTVIYSWFTNGQTIIFVDGDNNHTHTYIHQEKYMKKSTQLDILKEFQSAVLLYDYYILGVSLKPKVR